MDKFEFQQFLHHQIPITESMEISVLEFSPLKVKVLAKLEPNINHKSTAFGGSINCVMTVCGWALTFANIKDLDPEAHIVIRKSNINYLHPIKGDITAECTLTDNGRVERFLDMYTKHKKGILNLRVHCYDEDTILSEFEGQYVAFR